MANPWIEWWTDQRPLLLQPTFPRLLLALVLGVLVGAERQWRQRSAGIRTNTLVCLGAAAFVDLGATVGGPNTTNIISYVVSGVGFLGAGAIMKEGANVRGLNTAATLWCSAAVGACAGAGEMLDAVFVTVLLVSVNLALRPLSRYIDSKSVARTNRVVTYRLAVVCAQSREQEVRGLLLKLFAARPVLLEELRSEETDDDGEMVVQAIFESQRRDTALVEEIVREVKAGAEVSAVEWAETRAENE